MPALKTAVAAAPGVQPHTPAEVPKLNIRIPPILLEGDEPIQPPTPPSTTRKPAVGDVQEPSISTPAPGKMLVLAQAPGTLYASWSITAEEQERAHGASAHGHLLLLVWKGAVGRQLISELHISPESRHCFAHVPAPGEFYSLELGYRSREGQWCSLAVSEPVRTPGGVRRSPPGIASPVAFQLATVREADRAPVVPLASEAMQSTANATPGAADETHAITEPRTEQSQPSNVPAPGPVAHMTKPDAQQSAAPSPLPRSSDEALMQEWTPEAAREILSIAGLVEGEHGGVSSQEAAAPPVHLVEHLDSIAARGGAVSMPLVPSAAQESLSSADLAAGEEVAGHFWFQVNAEVVVYGAAAPGAVVRIGGRAIKLREDGSFSYRFALPDGQHALGIEAFSPAGDDTRSAELTLGRTTRISGAVGAHPQDPALRSLSPEHLDQ